LGNYDQLYSNECYMLQQLCTFVLIVFTQIESQLQSFIRTGSSSLHNISKLHIFAPVTRHSNRFSTPQFLSFTACCRVFGKNVLHTQCAFLASLESFSETTFYCCTNWGRYCHKRH